MKAVFDSTRKIVFVLMTAAIFACSFKVAGQTKVTAPKYDVPISEDIKIGKADSAAVESEEPVVKDAELTRYIQTLGDRLVAAVPLEYRRPEFTYTFKVVNDTDINAFAVPAGFIFIYRGLIDLTEDEGEVAGVLAHEISHVVLRHGVARRTRRQDTQMGTVNELIIKDKTVCKMLGNLCGILAQNQVLSAKSFLYVYEREDETDSDVLGTQIMSRAGYSISDMVGMLRILDRLRREARVPWRDTHPDPKARIARIQEEARFFPVSPLNPYRTGKFEQFKARLQMLYPSKETTARTAPPPKPERPAPSSGDRRSVPLPAAEFREIVARGFRLSIPANWQAHGEKIVFIAPAGAHTAEHGITHGAMFGFHQAPNAGSPEAIVKQYLSSVMSANPHLKMSGIPATATLGGATAAIKVVLVGTSPITNRTEVASFYVLPLSEVMLFYVVTIVPQDEQMAYERAFARIVNSIQPNPN